MKKTIYTIISAALVLLPALPVSAQSEGAVVDSLKTEKLYLPINLTQSWNLSTNSNHSYSGETLEKYPTLNLMNSFTGVIPGLYVTENNGATGMVFGSDACTLQIRNFTGITYIVDDVAIEEASEIQLSPEDIESITVISDIVDKVKFGPQVAHGAIYIRTLRGTPEGRQIKVGVEKGVDVVDRFPQWCNGVDYAILNNTARQNYNTLTGTQTYPLLYSDEAIAAYRTNNSLDLEYPNVDYRSLMLKDTRDFNKAYVLIRGGNDDVLYSGNIDYVNQGDIYKVGEKANFNRFNAKMNVDITINPKLKANFSFLGTYSLRNSPLADYGTTTDAYEFPTIWNRIQSTPAIEYPLYLGKDEETGKTTYPVSTSYSANPYASVVESGSYKEAYRMGVTKASVDYDLSSLLRGLKSETQISYNVAYVNRIGQGSDYVGYLYDLDDDGNINTQVTSHTGASASSASTYLTSYFQGLQFHEKLYHNFTKGNHILNTALTYYRSKVAYSAEGGYHKQQNGILSADYSYAGKYLVDFAVNYAGTSARKRGHRYQLFPAVGLGWIASEESFLKDVRWLPYLKLRAQAGVIGYEPFGTQYYWESYYTSGSSGTYGPYTTNQWFGSTTYTGKATTASRAANDELGWETTKEWSVGLDAVLFGKFSLGYTHYYSAVGDQITNVADALPLFFGAVDVIDNYERNVYWGDELTLGYSDRKGDFSYSLSGSLLHNEGVYDKVLETTTYDNLKTQGNKIGSVLGYDYLGQFKSQAEIDASPVQKFDAVVYPGDLKYRDVTGDGIVDSNDRTVIGNTKPKLLYSLNLHLAWKNVDLTVVGTGKAFFDTFLNNEYYWNGWGTDNYSAYVRDNYTNSAKYPRLSYVKSTNNFRNSQYWMVDGGFFKIQNAELGYNFNFRNGNKAGVSQIRVFARGANLMTISKIKDCDPEAMSSGVTTYPLFKTYTGGLKFTF